MLQIRMHRQTENTAGGALCSRKISLLVAKGRIGGLQVQWLRIIHRCGKAPFFQTFLHFRPAVRQHGILRPGGPHSLRNKGNRHVHPLHFHFILKELERRITVEAFNKKGCNPLKITAAPYFSGQKLILVLTYAKA